MEMIELEDIPLPFGFISWWELSSVKWNCKWIYETNHPFDFMKFHVGCDTLQRGMVEISGGTWTKTLSWRHRGWGGRAKRWYWLHQVYIIFTSFFFKDSPFDFWRLDLWFMKRILWLITKNIQYRPLLWFIRISSYFLATKQDVHPTSYPNNSWFSRFSQRWNWSDKLGFAEICGLFSRIVDHDIACLQCFQIFASNNLRSGEKHLHGVDLPPNFSTAWIQWFDKSILDAYLGGILHLISCPVWLRTSAERCIMH